jgi:hypothetical protein
MQAEISVLKDEAIRSTKRIKQLSIEKEQCNIERHRACRQFDRIQSGQKAIAEGSASDSAGSAGGSSSSSDAASSTAGRIKAEASGAAAAPAAGAPVKSEVAGGSADAGRESSGLEEGGEEKRFKAELMQVKAELRDEGEKNFQREGEIKAVRQEKVALEIKMEEELRRLSSVEMIKGSRVYMEMEQQCNTKTQHVNHLVEEYKKVSEEVQKERDNNRELQQQHRELDEAKLKEWNAISNELTRKLKKEGEKVKELQLKIDQVQRKSKRHQQTEQELAAANQSLTLLEATTKSTKKRLGEEQVKVQALQKGNEAHEEHLAKANAGDGGDMKEQLAAALKRVAQLQSELDSSGERDTVEGLISEVEDLTKAAEAAEDMKKSFGQQLKQKEEQQERLLGERIKLNQRMDGMERMVQEQDKVHSKRQEALDKHVGLVKDMKQCMQEKEKHFAGVQQQMLVLKQERLMHIQEKTKLHEMQARHAAEVGHRDNTANAAGESSSCLYMCLYNHHTLISFHLCRTPAPEAGEGARGAATHAEAKGRGEEQHGREARAGTEAGQEAQEAQEGRRRW